MIRVIPRKEQRLIHAHQDIICPAACLKIVFDAIQEIGVDPVKISATLAEGWFNVQSPNVRLTQSQFDSIRKGLHQLSDVASVSMVANAVYMSKMLTWSSDDSMQHISCIDGIIISVSKMFDKIPVRKLNRGTVRNQDEFVHAIRVYAVLNRTVDVWYKIENESGRFQPTKDLSSRVSSIFKIPVSSLDLQLIEENGLTGVKVVASKSISCHIRPIHILNQSELVDRKAIGEYLSLEGVFVAIVQGQPCKVPKNLLKRASRPGKFFNGKTNIVKSLNSTIAKVFQPGQAPILAIGEPFRYSNICSEDSRNVVGNFNQEFILVKRRNGLVLLDQHAAHERVRLEWLLSSLHSETETIPFKCRVRVDIGHGRLTSLGFHIEDNCIVAIPKILEGLETQLEPAIREIVDPRNVQSVPDLLMDLLKMKACRGAIMFGDKLSLHECIELLEQLCRCRFPGICAHGRPSIMFRPFV